MVWDGQCLRSLWNWHCRTAGPLMGCWTPKKEYHLFYEAKKSQVMAALPQNTATKASHVVKLPGERNTKSWSPEENIQDSCILPVHVWTHAQILRTGPCTGFQNNLKDNRGCNWQWSSSWDEAFLLLVSNCLLENETVGSRNVPQLENMNESKQINKAKIRFKPENKNQTSFESVLKLAGV